MYPPIALPDNPDPVRVGNPLFNERVNTGHHIMVIPVAPVTGIGHGKTGTISGRTPDIGRSTAYPREEKVP